MNSRVDIPAASRWNAWLELDFTQGPRGTRLAGCRHQGPLYVQKAFYPEGPDRAHAYLLHPPGGMVSGDDLRLSLCANEGTGVVITTPGAGRAYRSRPDRTLQRQRNLLIVKERASLEWLPQETLIYPDARARLDTDVQLEKDACFIGWEITSLGLPASGECFDRGELHQRLQIRHEGRIVLREQLHLTEPTHEMRAGIAGFQHKPVNSLMVVGPFETEQTECLERLRVLCDALPPGSLTGVTQVGAFIVLRALTERAEPAKTLFSQAWAELRPALLGVPACAPRIWAT